MRKEGLGDIRHLLEDWLHACKAASEGAILGEKSSTGAGNKNQEKR